MFYGVVLGLNQIRVIDSETLCFRDVTTKELYENIVSGLVLENLYVATPVYDECFKLTPDYLKKYRSVVLKNGVAGFRIEKDGSIDGDTLVVVFKDLRNINISCTHKDLIIKQVNSVINVWMHDTYIKLGTMFTTGIALEEGSLVIYNKNTSNNDGDFISAQGDLQFLMNLGGRKMTRNEFMRTLMLD